MENKFLGRVKYIAQFLGWVLLLLLVTEIFTRLTVVSSPTFDSKVSGGGVEIYGVEGYGIVYYLPNMEIATPYSGGDNIVTLGDSYTQARHSPFWRNFSSVAEIELRSSGYQIDVRNFGYMASALPYYLGIGESLLETYHPSVVVVQIAIHDLSSERVFDPRAPFYFELNDSGELVVKSRPKESEDYLKLASRIPNAPVFIFNTRSAVETYLNIQHGQKIQKPDDDAEPESAVITDQIVGKNAKEKFINQELALIENTYGDTPIVFIFRPAFSKKRLEFYYDDETKDFIAKVKQHPSWHVLCIDATFNQSFQNGHSPLGFGNTDPFSGHWNATGHRIVGQELAEILKELLNEENSTHQSEQCVFD